MATMATESRSPVDEFRRSLRDAIAALDASVPVSLSRAARSLLTAFEYEDRTLIRSHLEELRSAIVGLASGAITRQIALSRSHREQFERYAASYGVFPSEAADELGRAIGDLFRTWSLTLTELRDGTVRKLAEGGCAVPGADDLDREIDALVAFRASFADGWPWSHRPLPAIDREMVKGSRAAFDRVEGIPLADLIRQLGGTVGE